MFCFFCSSPHAQIEPSSLQTSNVTQSQQATSYRQKHYVLLCLFFLARCIVMPLKHKWHGCYTMKIGSYFSVTRVRKSLTKKGSWISATVIILLIPYGPPLTHHEKEKKLPEFPTFHYLRSIL